MGHAVQYGTFEDRADIKRAVDKWAQEAYYEGCDPLEDPIGTFYGRIEYQDKVLASKEDAIDYLEEACRREPYRCLAVRFRSSRGARKPAYVTAAEDRLAKAKESLMRAEGEIYAKRLRSKFVSCRKCGSKLARSLLRSNRCPVCRGDLRPDSVIKSVESKRERVEDAKRRYLESRRSWTAKRDVYDWLVRIEYHC